MATTAVYLGEGVYASFDGLQVWLTTLEGDRIALELQVIAELNRYCEDIVERIKNGSGSSKK